MSFEQALSILCRAPFNKSVDEVADMTMYQVRIILAKTDKDGVPMIFEDDLESVPKKVKDKMVNGDNRRMPKHVSWIGPGKPLWQMTKAEKAEFAKQTKGREPGEGGGFLELKIKPKVKDGESGQK